MADMKQISTIFLDLDGTLLPLDEEKFMAEYLVKFTKRCVVEGLDPALAQKALLGGVLAMKGEGGGLTNKERFWTSFFAGLSLPYSDQLVESFTRFYEEEFSEIQHIVSPSPLSREIVDILKEKGYSLILATTPVFPRVGTLERLSWVGLTTDDFKEITTYEDYTYTKPHTGYYEELMEKRGLKPAEVLMVGNNVVEDGAIMNLGIPCIFVTDFLINPEGEDLSDHSCYTLEEFHAFCQQLPERV